MHHLFSQCPKTRQPIDLQIFIDAVSLALISSNPLRFPCPHCGAEHETTVGAVHVEPLYSDLVTPGAEGVSMSHGNCRHIKSANVVLA
jgi:hypothetical protein